MRATVTTAALGVALALGTAATARADEAPATAASPVPVAQATPAAAQVWPTQPQGFDTVDIEGGGSNDWLNAGRGMWHSSYANAAFASTSGFKAYGGYLDSVRFGLDDKYYYAGVYVPTKVPHGTLNVEYGFSPQHNNLASSQVTAGYDLRLGGGFGVQAGYSNRSYTAIDASIWNGGFDKYIGNDRLAYNATFASLSGTPGVGLSQTVSWSKILPSDTVTAAVNVGRDIENTGFNHVAFYSSAVLVLDDVHWMDPHTAIHADVNYNSLAGAYQRYEVLLGLRVRL